MQMRNTGPLQIVGVTEKFQFVLLSQIGYKHDKKSFDHKKKTILRSCYDSEVCNR